MNKRKFEVITKWKKKTINYIYSKMVRYYHDFKWKDKWKSHIIVLEPNIEHNYYLKRFS